MLSCLQSDGLLDDRLVALCSGYEMGSCSFATLTQQSQLTVALALRSWAEYLKEKDFWDSSGNGLAVGW